MPTNRSYWRGRSDGIENLGKGNDPAGATISGAEHGDKKKDKFRQKMTQKSGNSSMKVVDSDWYKLQNNKAVSAITRIGSNPFVKRAGVAGTVIGTGASWMKYAHENGGDPKLATIQAGIDLGAGVAGAWAGAQVGAAIGALGGPVGAVIGAAIGGAVGAFMTTKASGWLNDKFSAWSRRSIWGD